MTNKISRFEPHPAAGVRPSGFIPPEAFTSSDKTEVNHFFHQSEDEKVLAGVWQCAPCREEISAYPVNEMMTVLEGSVTVTPEGEESMIFVPGDTFFIPKGTPCVWEITETLKKYYMIAE